MIKELNTEDINNSKIELQIENDHKGSICEKILRALPEWFGIESAIIEYKKDIEILPTIIAKIDGNAVGFLAYKKHYMNSYEVYVMGVLPKYHRQGVGKALIKKLELEMRNEGAHFLQVKTLSPARENKDYQLTREFYNAVGFTPIEELKTLWGEENPCLLMMKRV